MKRKVYLDGELGAKYGTELTMNVDSIAEVFKCLEANYPDVKDYLIDCHHKNIGFMCEVGGNAITADEEVILKFGKGDFYISPTPVGAKKGITKIIVAILIIVATIYLGPQALTTVGYQVGLSFGIGLALMGLQQIMAPDPSTEADQDEAYLYQGTGQNILEGDPVPILYGKLRVPGRPISFHVRNEHQRYYNTGNITSDSPEDTANPVMGNDTVENGTQGDNNLDSRPPSASQ